MARRSGSVGNGRRLRAGGRLFFLIVTHQFLAGHRLVVDLDEFEEEVDDLFLEYRRTQRSQSVRILAIVIENRLLITGELAQLRGKRTLHFVFTNFYGVFLTNLGKHQTEPNPTLGTIERAPFFAMPFKAGFLATKGGARTDARAQVLNDDGIPIEGLYAAGSVMANPFGSKGVGAGTTLGPCLTWGYIAARNALGLTGK